MNSRRPEVHEDSRGLRALVGLVILAYRSHLGRIDLGNLFEDLPKCLTSWLAFIGTVEEVRAQRVEIRPASDKQTREDATTDIEGYAELQSWYLVDDPHQILKNRIRRAYGIAREPVRLLGGLRLDLACFCIGHGRSLQIQVIKRRRRSVS